MALPICRERDESEIDSLFTYYELNKEKVLNSIRIENPWLFKLCQIAMKYEQGKFASSYTLGAALIYSLLSDAAKPNKLPEVTEETVASTLASFYGDHNKNYAIYAQMTKSDRVLFYCIVYVIDSDKYDEQEKDGLAKAFAQFYDLLYRQYESDDMEEMFS